MRVVSISEYQKLDFCSGRTLRINGARLRALIPTHRHSKDKAAKGWIEENLDGEELSGDRDGVIQAMEHYP